MKLKSYNILFQILSFLSDKTNGAPFVVKYKLLLGTILIGLLSSSAKATNKELVRDTIPPRPVPAEITCYKIAVTPNSQLSDSIKIRGLVKDEHGELLIGTIINVKNSTKATLTDINGNFSIKAKPDDKLVISYIGYKKQEISVSEISDERVTVVMGYETVIMCYDVIIISTPYNDDIYTSARKKISKLAYGEVDIAPVSPIGSVLDFEKWVQSNIRYSEQMQKDKVQGQITLSFAIDKKGNIVNKKVIAKLSKEADQEALRALSLSEKWKPGMHNNKPIKTTMTITVNFDAQ